MPKIVVNGKSYNSVDEMPAEIRAAYQKALEVLHDADKNGIPDFLEGKAQPNVSDIPINVDVQSGSRIVMGDNVYSSVDQLPPDARMKFDQAMAKLGALGLDRDGNGIPDVLEAKTPELGKKPIITPSSPMGIPPMTSQEPPPSVIQEEGLNFKPGTVFLLLILLLLGFLALTAYLVITLAG